MPSDYLSLVRLWVFSLYSFIMFSDFSIIVKNIFNKANGLNFYSHLRTGMLVITFNGSFRGDQDRNIVRFILCWRNASVCGLSSNSVHGTAWSSVVPNTFLPSFSMCSPLTLVLERARSWVRIKRKIRWDHFFKALAFQSVLRGEKQTVMSVNCI